MWDEKPGMHDHAFEPDEMHVPSMPSEVDMGPVLLDNMPKK